MDVARSRSGVWPVCLPEDAGADQAEYGGIRGEQTGRAIGDHILYG